MWKQLNRSQGLSLFSNCWLLPLTPSSMSSGVILLQRPYVSFSSPLLLSLRWEITTAAVALFTRSCDFSVMNGPFRNFYVGRVWPKEVIKIWKKFGSSYSVLKKGSGCRTVIRGSPDLEAIDPYYKSNGSIVYRSGEPIITVREPPC